MITTNPPVNPYDRLAKQKAKDAEESSNYLAQMHTEKQDRERRMREGTELRYTHQDPEAAKFDEQSEREREIDSSVKANTQWENLLSKGDDDLATQRNFGVRPTLVNNQELPDQSNDTPAMAQEAAQNAPRRAAEEPQAQAIQVSAPNKPGKYDMEFARWDDLMAEESRLSRAIEDYERKGPGASYTEQKTHTGLTHQQARLRQQFEKDREDFDLQPAYQAWHDARFKSQQSNDESAPSEPGMLSKILGGASDTAELALKHPQRFGSNLSRGVDELASMPFRAAETMIMGDKGHFPIMSPKRWIEQRRQEGHAGDTEAGVDPNSVGPEVTRAVGGSLLPIGPSVKAGQLIRNAAKGAGFGGGMDVLNQTAEGEPVTAKGLGTSAGIGGVLGALFGRFAGRAKGAGSEPGTGGPTQPRQLEYTDPHTIYQGGPDSVGPLKQLGERGSAIQQPGPLKQLEGPTPSVSKNATQLEVPQAWQNKIQALHREPNGEIIAQLPDGSFVSAGIPSTKLSTPDQPMQERGAIQRVLDAKRFSRDAARGGPGEAPTNAKGMVERVGAPAEATQTQAGADLAAKPGSTPYPGSIYGMPGVHAPGMPATALPPGAPPIAQTRVVPKPSAPAAPVAKPSVLDSIMSKGRTSVPSPVVDSPNVLPGWGKTDQPSPLAASILEKAKAKAQALPNTPAKVDAAISAAESEAQLGAILKGTQDITKVPVKRAVPKTLAPASPKGNEPQAVGALKEIGAELTAPKVGDVTEVRIPDDRLHPEVRARMESAKAQVPKVEATIEAARARLAAQPSGNIAKSRMDELKAGVQAKSAAAKENLADKKYKELRAAGVPEAKARDLAMWKTDQKLTIPETVLPTQKLDDFIVEHGYQKVTKEPFPGEVRYQIKDPKTGNVIASGDRDAILNAMEERATAKGVKLASFPGDLSGMKDVWDKALRKAGVKEPEGINVENAPARQGVFNKLSQPVATPDFYMRKNQAGADIVDSTSWGERMIGKRVNDLMYTAEGGTGSKPTGLFDYFEMPQVDRAIIDKALVYGDKVGAEFTEAQLMRQGMTKAQATGYAGVRDALGKVREWAKDSGELLDAKKLVGYIPRVWHGNIEIFQNGIKFIPKDGGSAFETLQQASAQAYKLKQANPAAKIDLKFFADPEYLGGRAFQDAQVVARLKRNLDKMGSATSAEVDAAYRAGRDLRGFTKHLEQRKGEIGYETEGLDKVLFNYFHQAAKMVEMRGVRTAAENVLKDHARELTEGQVHYLKNYVERVAGRPTWDQAAISGLIKDTQIGKWLDPAHGSKFIQDTRGLVNHLSIGVGNLGFAISQVDSLIRHTWPALQREGGKEFGALASEKFLLPAIKQFVQDKAIRQRLAHYGIIDIQHMSEARPQVGHKYGKGEWTASRVSMAMGTATEEFTRGVSAIARYNMARAQGLDDMAALKITAKFVDETQGRYTRAGKPAAFTGALGETVGMYKTFMSVYMQNAYKAMAGTGQGDYGTAVRYMMATMGVSGLMGLPFVDDLDEAFTKNLGWSPIESFYKHTPKGIMTGLASIVPGALGHPEFNMDWSRKAGMPDILPRDLKSTLGPVVGRIAPIISDALNGDAEDFLVDLLPNSVRGAINVYRGQDQGVVMGKNDRPTTRLEPGERALKAVGLPVDREIQEQRSVTRTFAKEEYRNDKLKTLAHKIIQQTASEAERQEYRNLGGTSARLKGEQQAEHQTIRERQMKHLPRILRRQELASE